MSQQQGPLVIPTAFYQLVVVVGGDVMAPGARHESCFLAEFEPGKLLQPGVLEERVFLQQQRLRSHLQQRLSSGRFLRFSRATVLPVHPVAGRPLTALGFHHNAV